MRGCAIVFEMNRKTEESDSEKENQKNQPDPTGGIVASEQADQTRKQNRLRNRHMVTPPDRVGSLRLIVMSDLLQISGS